jgi:hypothetical protein
MGGFSAIFFDEPALFSEQARSASSQPWAWPIECEKEWDSDMKVPSVKGTLFKNIVDQVLTLREGGEISEEELARELKSEDIDFLDREISISTWYPIASYGRLLTLLAKQRPPGSHREHHIEGGRQSAQRVIEMGIYAQLDDRTKGAWGDKVGRILVSLSGSFFNFTRWEWRGLEGDGFAIAVCDARDMPEVVVLRTQGFIEHLASRAAQGEVRVALERSPDGDELRFRARRIA